MSNAQASNSQNLTADPRVQAVVAWAVTALGMVAFHLLHIYAAIGQLATLANGHGHGHSHHHGGGGGHLDAYATMAEHNSGMAWMTGVFLILMIVAPIIGLILGSRTGAIVTLVVGAISSLLMIFDGLSHGFKEGNWPTLVVALVAIALPAAIATSKNLQWITAAGTGTEPTSQASQA